MSDRLQYTYGHTIGYLYDAAGSKLSVADTTVNTNLQVPMGKTVQVQAGNVLTTMKTDYCGNVIYEDGVLSKILTEEGYVTPSGSTAVFHYYLKDHEGNNRVVLNQNGAVEQVNNYYPFGGLYGDNTGGSVQPYMYNGKELDRMHGLDLFDYGARHYDAALGRWFTMDPLAEKYYSISPYVYCGNNSVNRIDPTGMIWDNPKKADELKIDINMKIASLNADIANYRAQIDKGDLSDKQIAKIEGQISDAKNRISNLRTSNSDIDELGLDQNNTYVLSRTSGGEHHVRQGDNGRVYIETSSDALSLHEISHVRQSLNAGGLKFSTDGNSYLLNSGNGVAGITKNEVEAYQIQYSFDLSFPNSLHGQGIQGINVHSVGGIMNNNGIPVYPIIRQYSIDINKFIKQQKKLLNGN